ncbi:MAG TPA: DUF2017 family protein [Ilumatobacteraceae bacterium]|nr:DUF2017 family protein [Ilumatobacteraceae bacterium]
MSVRLAPVTRREGTIGSYDLNLDVEERVLVASLLNDLRSLLAAPDADPDGRLRRLFPSAYHQERDQAEDAEFRRFMRDDLVASHLTSIERIHAVLAPANDPSGPTSSGDGLSGGERSGRLRRRKPVEPAPVVLDGAHVESLVQCVNGIRLVLGTMLDVSEDDPDEIDDDDPLIGERYLYDFLSWILDSAIRALQGV